MAGAAKSSSTELWLSQSCTDPLEPTLGLRWNCAADVLGYRYQIIEHSTLTLRTAYQVLASQYDPLGFMVPYTTRAKVLIQQMWSKQRGWDDPDLPPALQKAWEAWRVSWSISVVCPSLDVTHHFFLELQKQSMISTSFVTLQSGRMEQWLIWSSKQERSFTPRS